ncbi:Uncharacterised protein [uncultured archaeon]|nr:Uncharacterised protein [uncultured archaeon]
METKQIIARGNLNSTGALAARRPNENISPVSRFRGSLLESWDGSAMFRTGTLFAIQEKGMSAVKVEFEYDGKIRSISYDSGSKSKYGSRMVMADDGFGPDGNRLIQLVNSATNEQIAGKESLGRARDMVLVASGETRIHELDDNHVRKNLIVDNGTEIWVPEHKPTVGFVSAIVNGSLSFAAADNLKQHATALYEVKTQPATQAAAPNGIGRSEGAK